MFNPSQGKGKRAHPRGRSSSQLFPQHLLQPARLPGQTVTSAKGRGRQRTAPREEPGERTVRANCPWPLTAGYAAAESCETPWAPGPRQHELREGQQLAGHPPRGPPLRNNWRPCSPKLRTGPRGVAAASPRRASIPGLQPSAAELRGPERPPLRPRGRPRLPLTSLVPAVAEGPGAGPDARPGGAGSCSSAGPPRASRPGAAARPPRPCARPSPARGSDTRGALLTAEGADAGRFRERGGGAGQRLRSPCTRPGSGVS